MYRTSTDAASYHTYIQLSIVNIERLSAIIINQNPSLGKCWKLLQPPLNFSGILSPIASIYG